MKKQGWLAEFEALRGLSIVLLLILHSGILSLPFFGYSIAESSPYVKELLLGSFFFLAGYFFDMSWQKSQGGILSFFQSRFLRIFPPYWISLWLFTLSYFLRKRDLFVYILNLQIIFSPVYVKQLLTLWYISLLVVFYFIFGILVWKLRTNTKLAFGSAIPYLVLYFLHRATGLFDPRFFVYFFIFVSGIFFFRFETIRTYLFSISFLSKSVLAAFGVASLWVVLAAEFKAPNILYILGVDIFILTWVLLWLSIFRTQIGSWKIWGFLSTASYIAYLLHRPIWEGAGFYMHQVSWHDMVIFRATLASVAILILSYYLQLGYNRLLSSLNLKP